MQTAPGYPVAICTVATQSHLGQFVVLVESIFKHHRSLNVSVLVVDIAADEVERLKSGMLAYLAGRGDLELTILTLDQIYGDMADTLRFCYDAFELCNVARGGLHAWMFDHTDLDAWLYLDGDMVCFGSLDPVFSHFGSHDLILSAHRRSPCATGEEDLVLLMYGAYNGGLLGVRRGKVGEQFVRWFFDRMWRYGRVDRNLPLALLPQPRFSFFADQTWLGLVPMYFDNVLILKERGFNCGPWNVEQDDYLESAQYGTVRIGTDQLTLLHLSGWDPKTPHRIANYLPRDLSGHEWWCRFTAGYIGELERAQQTFNRPNRYATYTDGSPITKYQRRAYLKLQMAGKQVDESPFARRALIEGLSADFNTYDYVSPGLKPVEPDRAFPNMIEGNRHRVTDPHFRKEVPHKWYVDIRNPRIGFVSRDEAHIIHNTALLFQGKRALEIGCWMGWSACHLALGNVGLDIVDPALGDPEIETSVRATLSTAGIDERCVFHTGTSPAAVEELAERSGNRWSLIFIDGDHAAPHPLEDVMVAERHAESSAIILFHDLAYPGVGAAMDYLKNRGWNTMVYLTMQIMGVAWRGDVTPIRHIPDPNVQWQVPPWLHDYRIST